MADPSGQFDLMPDTSPLCDFDFGASDLTPAPVAPFFAEPGGIDQPQRRQGSGARQPKGFSAPFAYSAVGKHAAWFFGWHRDRPASGGCSAWWTALTGRWYFGPRQAQRRPG